jgi:GT2 family glycosyltransferase
MIEPIVCIPARNEADRLPSLLRSLQRQTWLRTRSAPLQAVLVLNNCEDESRAILQERAGEWSQLALHLIEIKFAPENAHVGSARRLAMDTAAALACKNSVLLTTDADAIPRDDWIDANLRAFNGGADLVGGYLVGDKDEEALLGAGFVRRAARHLYYAKLVDRLTCLLNPVPHDPWPRHSDHTGASLAVRGEVYRAVGGMPALPFREDLAFVERACRAGYRLRHALDVQVKVSARLDGRAAGGMADCLKAWLAAEEGGRPHLVEDPHAIVLRLHSRQLGYATAPPIRLADDVDTLGRSKGGVVFDGGMADEGAESVEIEIAISQLKRMIADKEGRAHVAGSSTLDILQRVD